VNAAELLAPVAELLAPVAEQLAPVAEPRGGAPAESALLGVYRPAEPVFVSGSGCRLRDDRGRRYLDFGSGIGVNALGYGDAGVARALARGVASGLIHTSNLFRTTAAPALAQELVEQSFADRVFFCNSGAEANEAAFKFARRWAREQSGAPGGAVPNGAPGGAVPSGAAGWRCPERRRRAGRCCERCRGAAHCRERRRGEHARRHGPVRDRRPARRVSRAPVRRAGRDGSSIAAGAVRAADAGRAVHRGGGCLGRRHGDRTGDGGGDRGAGAGRGRCPGTVG
jgi:hypothetical protein